MAYSAKCDTATHTKWWITGTGSTVNRLSEVMDDNASGVEEDDNPGNYQPWTEFMTEHVEDRVYQVHQLLEIGDGSTATALISLNEIVWFDSSYYFSVVANAALTLGEKTGDWSINGAFWEFDGPATTSVNITNGGDIYIYGSRLHCKAASSRGILKGGVVVALNSIFSSEHNQNASAYNEFRFGVTITSLTLQDVMVYNCRSVYISETPVIADDIRAHDTEYGLMASRGATIKNALTTTFSTTDARQLRADADAALSLLDPKAPITTPQITNRAGNEVKEQYTVNIKVADKDGAAIESAVVDCVGSDSGAPSSEYDTAQWTAGTVTTDASGDITEQTVTAKNWISTSETLTDYNYFKFTISKAGYETLVLENVTVDSPIVWHLELQPKFKADEMGNIYTAINENTVMAV